MKKIITILALVLLLAVPAFAAGNDMEIDVNGYAGGTGLQLSFGSDNSTFALSVQPGVDLYFDGLNGLDLRASLGFGNDVTALGLDAGYARKFPLDNGITLGLKTGLCWTGMILDGMNAHVLGLFASLDIRYDIYKNVYVMVGFRDTINIASFVNSDFGNTSESSFNNMLTLPTVGFGCTF